MTTLPDAQILPVRHRRVLLRTGAAPSTPMVYCHADKRSVPLSRCHECGFGGAVSRDARGGEQSIACHRAEGQATPEDTYEGVKRSLVAGALPVGVTLTRGVVCVGYDVPLRIAARALETDPSLYGVPVVDLQARFVGLLPRATAMLAIDGSSEASVAGRMAFPTGAVDERAPISEALGVMASRRTRELVVVGERREVVGVIRDLDALRFVAHVTRTGALPSKENAA